MMDIAFQDTSEHAYDSDFEEMLISAVKSRPQLYTLKSKSYKDSIARNNLWLEIEKETGIPVELLKKRWKTIRDYYTRNKNKMPNGTAAKKKRIVDFQRMQSLRFLDGSFSLDNITISNVSGAETEPESNTDASCEVGVPVKVEVLMESDMDESTSNFDPHLDDFNRELEERREYLDMDDERSSGNGRSSEITKEPHRRISQETYKDIKELIASKRASISKRQEVLKSLLSKCEEEEDEIDFFFKSIALTVKKFPKKLQLDAKRAISSVIFDLEAKNLNE